MAGTFINGRQIEDGTVSRVDLNTTVTGNAVIRKILSGSNGIIIDTSTGVDAGTGDVTLKADLTYFNTQYQNRTIAQGQNLVWAGPVSGSGVPTFRALTAGDIPALPYISTETDPVYTASIPNQMMVKGDLGTGDDLDNYIETGIWFAASNTISASLINAPVPTSGDLFSGYLEVVRRLAGGSTTQAKYQTYTENRQGQRMWYRSWLGTTWGPWLQVADRNWTTTNFLGNGTASGSALTATSAIDLDTIALANAGYVNNATNTPYGTVSGTVMTLVGGTVGMQTFMRGIDDAYWYRSRSSGVYTSWHQVASRDWVTSQGYTTNTGTVTSVAATVAGSALNVTGSPITSSGTLAFTWGGTTSQYVNGAGGLTTFPTIPTVNNGTLTLSTSGIATGSQTFSANQATNATFTVNVPGTDLGTTANWGEITSSTGTNTILNTLGRATVTDGNEIASTIGFSTVHNVSGSTNFPAAAGGGFRYVRTAGNANGTIWFWNEAPNSKDVWFKTGASASTWHPWERIASKEWVVAQGYTTNLGTVTSVNVSGSGALGFSGGPVTSSGTISASWSGSTSQYVRGDGSLATFPSIPTVNNATLTLATSGIATGSQTFTANQSTNATFTVSVPGTNVGGAVSEWGRVTSSTGTNGYIYGLRSYGNGVTDGDGINATESGMILFANSSGSTNFPTTNAGTLIHVQTNINSALGAYKIWSAHTNDNELYYRTGASASTWNSWQRFASKEWVIAQGYTTNTGTVTSVTIGNGLTGTSPITSTGTITLGTPSSITLSSTNAVTSTSHTHAFAPGGTTAQYIRGDGSLATFPSIPAGTVTSVAAGNGMNFTTITGSGSVTLGTPSNITLSSTNSVTSTSHTHAFVPGGTTAQYIRGDGSLATFPTIPSTPNLQQVTDVGNTTTNNIVITNSLTSTIPLEISRAFANTTPLQKWSRGGTDDFIQLGSSGAVNFAPILDAKTSGTNVPAFHIRGWGKDDFGTSSAIILQGSNSTHTAPTTGGDILRVLNYTTNLLTIASDGNTRINSLAGTGTRMVTASSTGVLSTATIPSGTVTSVGLSMPSAFSVSGSPVTSSGTLTVTGAGTTSQYIRGDGTLATFPTIPTYTGSTSIVLSGSSFQRAALMGDVTAALNNNTTTISNNAVTYAKMQDIASGTLIGRGSTGTGDPEQITIGPGLFLSPSGELSNTMLDKWQVNSSGYLARDASSGGSGNGLSTGLVTGTPGGIQTSGVWVSSSTYTVQTTDHNMIFSASCAVTLPDPSVFLHRMLGVKTYATVTFVGSHVPYDNTTATTSFTGNASFRILQAITTPSGPRWMILQ